MNKYLKEALEMSLYILVALIASLLIVTFVGQRTVVSGSSMNDTLFDGDNLIVDKITYRFRDPERFEVIVFPFHGNRKDHYIKRVIGLPGESIRISKEGEIYINGLILEEDFGKEVMVSPGRADTEIVLGADEYFVLGDNRNDSSDSRDFMVGNIKRDEIIGRAWMRVFPFNSIGFVKHD